MSISSPQDFKVAALIGLVQGVSQLAVLGRAFNIQTAEPPFTIGAGNVLQLFAAAEESWEIVSSSASDTAAGTGARTVLIQYLDGDYVSQQLTVTLNGLTAVPIASDCFRHQSSIVLTVGSTLSNVGQLTVRVAGGGATRAVALATHCSTRQASFTIPATHKAYIQSTAFTLGKVSGLGAIGSIAAMVRDPTGPVRLGQEFTIGEPGISLTFPSGLTLPEKTTLEYRVTDVSANGTDVSVITAGLLIDISVLKWPVT